MESQPSSASSQPAAASPPSTSSSTLIAPSDSSSTSTPSSSSSSSSCCKCNRCACHTTLLSIFIIAGMVLLQVFYFSAQQRVTYESTGEGINTLQGLQFAMSVPQTQLDVFSHLCHELSNSKEAQHLIHDVDKLIHAKLLSVDAIFQAIDADLKKIGISDDHIHRLRFGSQNQPQQQQQQSQHPALRGNGLFASVSAASSSSSSSTPQTQRQCRLEFASYESNEWERDWVSNYYQRARDPCPHLQTDDFRAKSERMLRRNIELVASHSRTHKPEPVDEELFSKMHFRLVCCDSADSSSCRESPSIAAFQYIEPLMGILRDPLTICNHYSPEMRVLVQKQKFDNVVDEIQSKRFISFSPNAPLVVLSGLLPDSTSALTDEMIESCRELTWNGLDDIESTLLAAAAGAGAVGAGSVHCHYMQPPWFHRSLLQQETQHKQCQMHASLAARLGVPQSINFRMTRTFLFDLGSQYYNGGRVYTESGSSSKYFHEMFATKRIPFDRIIAYEYEKLDPHLLWDQVPSHLMGVYVPINHGVTADINSPFHPWRMIKKLVSPEDYVIVKLDIDTPSIENPLFYQLWSIAHLVDEFCFEHHVDLPPMINAGWGWAINGSLMDSYDNFLKLRQHGIRAHSWP